MKLATILGSPRIKGNTAKVLELFEGQMSQNHTIDRINVTDYEINSLLT